MPFVSITVYATSACEEEDTRQLYTRPEDVRRIRVRDDYGTEILFADGVSVQTPEDADDLALRVFGGVV